MSKVETIAKAIRELCASEETGAASVVELATVLERIYDAGVLDERVRIGIRQVERATRGHE